MLHSLIRPIDCFWFQRPCRRQGTEGLPQPRPHKAYKTGYKPRRHATAEVGRLRRCGWTDLCRTLAHERSGAQQKTEQHNLLATSNMAAAMLQSAQKPADRMMEDPEAAAGIDTATIAKTVA